MRTKSYDLNQFGVSERHSRNALPEHGENRLVGCDYLPFGVEIGQRWGGRNERQESRAIRAGMG
jgi:hypothetical protein